MKKVLIILVASITLNSYGADNMLSEEDIQKFLSMDRSEEAVAKRKVEGERKAKKIMEMFEENYFVGKDIEDVKQLLGPYWDTCPDDIACVYTDFSPGYSLEFLQLYTDKNGKIINVKIVKE